MSPKKGVRPIHADFTRTDALCELVDVLGCEHGPPVGIPVDSLDQHIFLRDRQVMGDVLTSGSMFAAVPVSDGCSWQPEAF